MTRPLLFFDGTNVMLIRESDAPNKNHYPIEMYEGREAYSKALEAAKKKAIRVELSLQTDVWVLDRYGDGTYTTLVDDKKTVMVKDQMYSLPSGYTYEVHYNENPCTRGCATEQDCNSTCFSPHTAIIKPLQPEESEDDLWEEYENSSNGLYESYRGNLISPVTYERRLQELKSKYTITRKP